MKNRRGDELTEEELFALRGIYVRSHLGWQKDYLLYEAGLLDEEQLRVDLPTMWSLLTESERMYAGREHWEEVVAEMQAKILDDSSSDAEPLGRTKKR